MSSYKSYAWWITVHDSKCVICSCPALDFSGQNGQFHCPSCGSGYLFEGQYLPPLYGKAFQKQVLGTFQMQMLALFFSKPSWLFLGFETVRSLPCILEVSTFSLSLSLYACSAFFPDRISVQYSSKPHFSLKLILWSLIALFLRFWTIPVFLYLVPGKL